MTRAVATASRIQPKRRKKGAVEEGEEHEDLGAALGPAWRAHDPVEQALAQHRRGAHEGHDEGVAVRHVHELVREDGRELLTVQATEQSTCHHDDGVLRRAAGGERVGHVGRGNCQARHGQVGHAGESLHDRVEPGLVLAGHRVGVRRCECDALAEGGKETQKHRHRCECPHRQEPGTGPAQDEHEKGDRKREVEDPEQRERHAHAHGQSEVTPNRFALHYGSGVFVGPPSRPAITRTGERPSSLRVGEDMEELHVEPVEVSFRELRDPIALLEHEDEIFPGVVHLVDLVEPEHQLGGLLAGREEEPSLDVVGPPELVTLLEDQLPGLARGNPILDRGRIDGEVLIDLDLGGRVGALRRRRPRLHLDRGHVKRMPVHPRDKT